MAELTRRNKILIEHLKQKYLNPKVADGIDPNKNNRIDIVGGSELFNLDEHKINSLKSAFEMEYIQDRIEQLVNNYDPNDIYEISPYNRENSTSFTEDKKILILCLRKKEKDKEGKNELHDINTIMFVVIHELSHMMNDVWGHKQDFWMLFKFMLLNSVEAGIYRPVDYSKAPILYCGLLLTYSPLFDPNV
jgi:hypothetical protein